MLFFSNKTKVYSFEFFIDLNFQRDKNWIVKTRQLSSRRVESLFWRLITVIAFELEGCNQLECWKYTWVLTKKSNKIYMNLELIWNEMSFRQHNILVWNWREHFSIQVFKHMAPISTKLIGICKNKNKMWK